MNVPGLLRKTESADFLDNVSALLQRRIAGTLSGTGAREVLRGSWLGHPLHPVLVTVPIGAWSGSLVLDTVLRDHVAARRLIGLGLLSAVPTLTTGWVDWAERDATQRRVGLIHAGANALGIAAFTASFLRRRRGTDAQAVALSVAGFLAVGVGGTLGGHLTYAMGAGVGDVERSPSADTLPASRG
ncbi:DUF2231 domain-containing protein [Rhodococcus sp. NPDC019627]|uniref:DUF2231 domain-containing protein n=1 Tax=unclassified Rhodococcus (in: high G+C Gram-positive bacteria) TaxID=192944 RepID=UPI003411A8C5